MSHKKQSTQAGFGIGTILIVVVLVAAIAAAIAAATRSGGIGSFFGETDRIYASTIINSGTDLSVALQRAFAIGYDAQTISLEDPSESGKFDLFNRTNGYLKRPQLPSSSFAAGQTQQLDLAYQAVFEDGRPESIVVIYPLEQKICRQINNIISNTPLDAELIDETTIAVEDFLVLPEAGESAADVDTGAYFFADVNGSEQEVYEGCAAFANDVYAYFRVL